MIHRRQYRSWSVLIAAALLLTACSLKGGAPEEAPEVRLPNLDGRMVSLSQYHGRVVMVNFWATWCPPCRKEIPDFVSLQREFGPQGLTIVGISVDDEGLDQVRAFSRSHDINFPVMYGGQRSEEIIERFGGIRGIPTTFLVDRTGRIVRKVTGPASRSSWVKAIEPLL
jgi:cytochrome c biogenesis protein CcmG/thiol:disulfide interchange protein DsbE